MFLILDYILISSSQLQVSSEEERIRWVGEDDLWFRW